MRAAFLYALLTDIPAPTGPVYIQCHTLDFMGVHCRHCVEHLPNSRGVCLEILESLQCEGLGSVYSSTFDQECEQ